MKSIKSILKIAGAVMAVIGTVLVVVGFLDEICAGVKKLAACRARRGVLPAASACRKSLFAPLRQFFEL